MKACDWLTWNAPRTVEEVSHAHLCQPRDVLCYSLVPDPDAGVHLKQQQYIDFRYLKQQKPFYNNLYKHEIWIEYTSLAVPRPMNWLENPSVNFLTPILQNLGRSSVLGEAVVSSRVSSSLTEVMIITIITCKFCSPTQKFQNLFLLHVVAHDSSLDGNC